MKVQKVNNINFNGGLKIDNNIANKLDNIKALKKLVDTAEIDLSIGKGEPSKYLPNHDGYTLMASKMENNRLFTSIVVKIYKKEISNSEFSKNIFEASENVIGKLFGSIGKSISDAESFSTKRTVLLSDADRKSILETAQKAFKDFVSKK